MVSRSETARALLTQGEIMQLPDTNEIVMLAGVHPIRARKARYFRDPRLSKRVERPPTVEKSDFAPDESEWHGRHVTPPSQSAKSLTGSEEYEVDHRQSNGGIRQSPELPDYEDVALPPVEIPNEFEFADRTDDDQANRNRRMAERMQANARRAALDPGDGIEL
jgi:type IV secretion system protein VirD4